MKSDESDTITATRRRSGMVGLAVVAVAVAGPAAAVLAACGSGDDVEIAAPWARTSPMAATAGAVYMDITAAVDDRLISASVPDDVAATVEIHETVMRSDTEDGDMDDGEMEEGDTEDGDMEEDEMEEGEMENMDGAMTMRELQDGLVLPAGETVSLEPGGYHVMLLDLPDPLETGETFDLTLEFESGESQVVSIEVRDEAP